MPLPPARNDPDRQLPNATPHTLPRTSISVALLANRFDVLWVMRKVGITDSITAFVTPEVFRPFGLPRALAA